MNVEFLCFPCAERREELPVEVEYICQECFEYANSEILDFEKSGGKPEVRTRAEPFDFTLKETALPKELGTVTDIAPVNALRQPVCMLLAESGQIFRFDCDTDNFAELAHATAPVESREPWADRVLKRRLHASDRGEFAAVVNDYGHHGQVIDLRSGEVTLTLDGGNYHEETVPFSFAFAHLNTKVFAIHRTAWNRLDFSDAASGELLSERPPVFYKQGEKLPEHYLDYFHGALYLNPSGTRIVDDGWVWAPIGIPAAWSVERWLSHNKWEAEDGPTKVNLCYRHYYWDNSLTWLDETRVAIPGIGEDDRDIIQGARVFEVTDSGAREITSFAGPAGLFFSDGVSLFTSDSSGLSRWDLQAGARTGHLKDFQPTRYHRGADEFLQVKDGVLRRGTVH